MGIQGMKGAGGLWGAVWLWLQPALLESLEQQGPAGTAVCVPLGTLYHRRDPGEQPAAPSIPAPPGEVAAVSPPARQDQPVGVGDSPALSPHREQVALAAWRPYEAGEKHTGGQGRRHPEHRRSQPGDSPGQCGSQQPPVLANVGCPEPEESLFSASLRAG